MSIEEEVAKENEQLREQQTLEAAQAAEPIPAPVTDPVVDPVPSDPVVDQAGHVVVPVTPGPEEDKSDEDHLHDALSSAKAGLKNIQGSSSHDAVGTYDNTAKAHFETIVAKIETALHLRKKDTTS